MPLKYHIRKTWKADHKCEEARFFFRLMNQSQHRIEFTFYLSAFLSATAAALADEALKSDKPEFAGWYMQIRPTILGEPFALVRELRNCEAHHGGSPAYQRDEFAFGEEGIAIDGELGQALLLESDFNSEHPEMRVRVDEHAQEGSWTSVPVARTWVWDADGEPDVMNTCETALQALCAIINDWKNRGFGESTSS